MRVSSALPPAPTYRKCEVPRTGQSGGRLLLYTAPPTPTASGRPLLRRPRPSTGAFESHADGPPTHPAARHRRRTGAGAPTAAAGPRGQGDRRTADAGTGGPRAAAPPAPAVARSGGVVRQ